MIQVTDINGRPHYLSPQAIARVSEADTSSQFHGIRAIVKTFDGEVIECQESAEQIAVALQTQGATGLPR